MTHQDILKHRQEGAKRAYDLMLDRIIGYSPCGKLTIEDAQYLARVAQTAAFEASEFSTGFAA